jgi:heme exporter protein D
MSWNSAAEFFAMGGYGFYVWTSYAVCAACMLVEPLLARQRHGQALRSAALQAPDTEETA